MQSYKNAEVLKHVMEDHRDYLRFVCPEIDSLPLGYAASLLEKELHPHNLLEKSVVPCLTALFSSAGQEIAKMSLQEYLETFSVDLSYDSGNRSSITRLLLHHTWSGKWRAEEDTNAFMESQMILLETDAGIRLSYATEREAEFKAQLSQTFAESFNRIEELIQNSVRQEVISAVQANLDLIEKRLITYVVSVVMLAPTIKAGPLGGLGMPADDIWRLRSSNYRSLTQKITVIFN
jgi:hypothetical protein